MTSREHKLFNIIKATGPVAVAVSGGVDSVTLALIVGTLRSDSQVFHAISPAVPLRATARVRRFAASRKWNLNEIVAGEFEDPKYMSNPYNRCFYCKTNLYQEIRKHTALVIISGTNVDDLSDFRPGLIAAKNFNVRHPFVEAGITKNDIRALARKFGTSGLAELPAAPCLSSRVETGLDIDADVLLAVNKIEEWIQKSYSTKVVRCRVREMEIVIETDGTFLRSLTDSDKDFISTNAESVFSSSLPGRRVRFAEYRMGSAFVEPAIA